MLSSACQHRIRQRALQLALHRPEVRSKIFVNRSVSDQREVSETASAAPSVPAAPLITSVSNPYVKHCVKLREKSKYRSDLRRVLLCGSVLLKEVSAQTPLNIRVLFVPVGSRPDELPSPPQKVIEVTEPVLKKLSGLETAAGLDAIAEVELPPTAWAAAGAGQKLQRVLALDGVQDPGNMGTLLRTARAFGWDAAWLLPGCCDPFNDKALRASRGAALTLPLSTGSWDELLQVADKHHLQLLAAEPEPEGDSQVAYKQQACGQGVVLVLGSEGQGLSAEALHHCRAVSIPMSGNMESLNVSVAGGILMFALSEGLEPLVKKLDAIIPTSTTAVQ